MSNEERQPSRRDLFSRSFGATESSATPATDARPHGPLFDWSANAMGCQFQLLCGDLARECLAKASPDAFEQLQFLEQRLSIYQPTSEMSAINRTATDHPVEVESDLFDLLEQALAISEATDGAFDLSAMPLSRLWKVHRRERTIPTQDEIDECRRHTGYRNVRLDADRRTIEWDDPQLQLDLGGIGKGFALECLRGQLIAEGCRDFMIHGGQSSVVAVGQRDTGPDRPKIPWQLGISHPLTPGIRLAQIDLRDRAIGTSGSGRQSHVIGGQRYGHIIDPRTGWPADHYLSVTVLAQSATLADALATALFVAGPDYIECVCDRFELSAITISERADSEGLAIQTWRMPDEDFCLVQR